MVEDLGLSEVTQWLAVADIDGWGEEVMLLASLLSCQIKKPISEILPGWEWMQKDKTHGRQPGNRRI
jgi:hypothetical protein